ncbi:MAG: antitoxin Xre/MbcA/ParS toxin-binding domain-containing protein [bacterium]
MNKRIRRKRVRRMLLVELAVLFREPADAIVWLETPLEQFEGRTPRETIAAGEVERVTLLLDELNTAARKSGKLA